MTGNTGKLAAKSLIRACGTRRIGIPLFNTCNICGFLVSGFNDGSRARALSLHKAGHTEDEKRRVEGRRVGLRSGKG
jgi:hypothetical protein